MHVQVHCQGRSKLGHDKLSPLRARGKSDIVLNSGDFFGEMTLLSGIEPAPATLTTGEDGASISMISRRSFESCMGPFLAVRQQVAAPCALSA
jgi:CRP-like cAMP-binding protein